MANVDIRVVHTTVTTSGSTQDITVSGFGTPKGALFFWGHATADSGTVLDHAHIGMGATDFTREWACSYFSEFGSDPSQCTNMGSTAKCIQFSNTAGTGVETNMEATASVSGVTDGLKLTWTGTPGTARRFTVIMFTGDNCHVEAGTVLNNASLVDVAHAVTLTDMVVRPEVVFVGMPATNAFSSTVSVDAGVSFGFGEDHSGTIAQAHQSWSEKDARGPANLHGGNVESTHIASFAPYTGNNLFAAWELTATGVNGTPRGTVELTKRISAATTSFGYFCFSSDGNNEYDISLPLLDHTTTGVKNYTTPGFQPQALILFPTNLTDVGINKGPLAAGLGASAIDEDTLTEGCYHTQSDEVDGTDSSSVFKSDLCDIHTDTGGNSYRTTFTAFTTTGFDYTPSLTSAATKPTPVLCIEQDSGSILEAVIDAQADPAFTNIAGDSEHDATIADQAATATTNIDGDSEHDATVADQAATATTNIDGDSEHDATVADQAATATTSITGDSEHDATVADQASTATTNIDGDSEHDATVADQAATATTSITGDSEHDATIDAQAGPAETNIQGGSSTEIDAVIDAQAATATTNIDGDSEHDATVADQASTATTNIDGDSEHDATVADQASTATTSIAGDSEHGAVIDAQAGTASTNIDAILIALAQIDAQASLASTNITGDSEHDATVADQAATATTNIDGDSEHDAVIDAQASTATTDIDGNNNSTGNDAVIVAVAGPALTVIQVDVNPFPLGDSGSTGHEWVQVFDSTYTKIRGLIKKTGTEDVHIPVRSHSITIRRIL